MMIETTNDTNSPILLGIIGRPCLYFTYACNSNCNHFILFDRKFCFEYFLSRACHKNRAILQITDV